MKKEYKYRLYIFFNGQPIQGPYPADTLEEYVQMLDDLFLTDDYPMVHISLVKHENNTDNPFLYCYTREGYINFKETHLVIDKPKMLTKEMKSCNTKYGDEAGKQRFTNS